MDLCGRHGRKIRICRVRATNSSSCQIGAIGLEVVARAVHDDACYCAATERAAADCSTSYMTVIVRSRLAAVTPLGDSTFPAVPAGQRRGRSTSISGFVLPPARAGSFFGATSPPGRVLVKARSPPMAANRTVGGVAAVTEFLHR